MYLLPYQSVGGKGSADRGWAFLGIAELTWLRSQIWLDLLFTALILLSSASYLECALFMTEFPEWSLGTFDAS